MITIKQQQGSDEWKAKRHLQRNASEASMIMGVHKNVKRDELIHMKATATEQEFSDWFQNNVLDRGHEIEALARPVIEKNIDEELFPMVGKTDDEYLNSSFDGLNFDHSIVWECKQWNKSKAEDVKNQKIPECDYWQVVQELAVSGADLAIYTVSDGTEENTISVEMKRSEADIKILRAAWAQFDEDLAAYKTKLDAGEIEKPVEAEAEVIKDLPAITYKMNGLALTSDFDKFKEQARLLIEKSKKELVTDDDFATAETLVKMFKTAEDKLSNLAEQVIGEVSDIDSFIKDLKHVSEEMRQARLATDKLVKSEKESRKLAIKQKAEAELNKFIADKNELLEGITLPAYHADFAGAMKGLKTMASIQSAVNDCLANAKVDISQMFDEVSRNLKTLDKLASDYKFLFADLQQIISKEQGDFEALVKSRISDHKEAEAERVKREEEAKQQIESQQVPDDEGEELPIVAETKETVSAGFGGGIPKAKRTTQDEISSIVKYITDEGFPLGHIKAIAAIVYAFNESPESEKEIFEFTESLKSKYGKAA